MESKEAANMFKALCDKSRVEILFLLKNGEACACDLLENLEISQSTLSHHMKILLKSEIVRERKSQKWSFYTINNEKLEDAKQLLDSLICHSSQTRSDCV